MTLSPIVFGNIFNIAYGRVYDAHSVMLGDKDPERVCEEGVQCYRMAYTVTAVAAVAAFGVSIWSVRWDWAGRRGRRKVGRLGREA